MKNTSEYNRAYYQINKERLKDIWQKRYRANPREEMGKVKAYRQANPERVALWDAISRCHNPKHASYYLYGARGIKCLFTTSSQLIAIIGKRPEKGYSLDRINNNGNYAVGNVRWATAKEQANNKRNSK